MNNKTLIIQKGSSDWLHPVLAPCRSIVKRLRVLISSFILLPAFMAANAWATLVRVESAGANAISAYAYGYCRVTLGTNVVYFGTGGAGLCRGWLVATLDPSQASPTVTPRLFDPWGNESDAQALADYLEALPSRTLVLLTVCDEAGINPWDVCDLKQSAPVQALLAALRRLGSLKVTGYCYRDSFLMAAVKGDGYPLIECLGKFLTADMSFDVAFGKAEPVVITQPVSQTVKAGNPLRLSAAAVSSSPMTIQWRKNGLPIVDATNVFMALPTVSTAETGAYSAEFRNSAGSAISSNAEVAIIGYPRPGELDSRFQLTSTLPGPAEFHAAIPDSQGRWIVAMVSGYRPFSVPAYAGYSGGYGPGAPLIVTKLLANGQEDPTFNRFTSSGMAYALAVDAQGRVYVATGNKRELTGLTRLLADGSKDTNFVVSIDWTGSSPEYGAWVNAVVIDSQGRVVVGGHFSSVNGVQRWGLARLLSDGSVDDSFDPGFISGTVATLNLLAQDSVLVLSGCPPTIGRDDDAIELSSGDPAHFFVINSDGSLDLSLDGGLGFTMPTYWGHGQVKATHVLPNGFALVGKGIKVVGDGTRYDVVFLDQTGRAAQRFLFPDCYASTIQNDGRLLLGGVSPNSVGRLNEDGALDPLFKLQGMPNSLVTLLAIGRDNNVLVGGLFSEIGDTPCQGLAYAFGTTGRLPMQPRIEDLFKDGAGFRAGFSTEWHYEYRLETSEDATGPWALRGSEVLGNGARQQFFDPNPSEAQFYRLRTR